jgi:hypothetical protein
VDAIATVAYDLAHATRLAVREADFPDSMGSSTTAGLAGRLRPLTDRILARLPGPPVVWIAAWALVPWANAGANLLLDTEGTSAVWEQSDVLIVLNYAALSFAVVVTLWGTDRIARRVESSWRDI